MSKPPTAAEIAERHAKRLSDVPYDGDKDVPVSISISLPKSMIRKLEERRLANKVDADGPKTVSGLIRMALEKEGYGS